MSPISPLTAPPMPDTEATAATEEAAVAPADGATGPSPTSRTSNKPRPYAIGQRFTGTADKLKAKVDELVKEGRGEVFIVVGTQEALQPTLAIKAYAKDNDVDGKYETVATNAFKEYGPLKSKVKETRSVEGL